MTKRLALWLTAIVLLPVSAGASPLAEFREAVATGRHALAATIENDSMLLDRSDGLYTSGLRFRSAWTLGRDREQRSWQWHIGQELYTASDIKLRPAQIAPNDRPYAAWLYTGVQREIRYHDGSYRKLGVDIGCLGPCGGGELTQKTLHSMINQPQPEAWSTQLGNEFGVVLHGAWSPARWAPAHWLDVQPRVYGRFGNIFTDAGVDVTLRAGRLSPYPHQPALFGFLRAGGRAVGYNATLQGGYFRNERARTVGPRRGVGEIEIGVSWQGTRFGLTAAVVRRGNEVSGLPDSQGRQNFAKVELVYHP